MTEPNPYEPPRTLPQGEKLPRGQVDVAKVKRQNKTAVIVILALLMVPASSIAFFIVCVSTSRSTFAPVREPTEWGLFLSCLAALVVIGGFVWAIVAVSKRYPGS